MAVVKHPETLANGISGSPVIYEEVARVLGKVFGAGPGQSDGSEEVWGPLEVLDLKDQAVRWEKS